MTADKITSVAVKESTKARLKSFGSYGDSMERILHRLMDSYETSQKQKTH